MHISVHFGRRIVGGRGVYIFMRKINFNKPPSAACQKPSAFGNPKPSAWDINNQQLRC